MAWRKKEKNQPLGDLIFQILEDAEKSIRQAEKERKERSRKEFSIVAKEALIEAVNKFNALQEETATLIKSTKRKEEIQETKRKIERLIHGGLRKPLIVRKISLKKREP